MAKGVGGSVAALVVMIGFAAAIYVPVIDDCNGRGGEVVLNAFKWPVCVAGAPK